MKFSKCIPAILLCIFLINAAVPNAEPVNIPGMVWVKAESVAPPPVWAVMQRNLIKTMEDAAPLFIDKFTNRDGTLKKGGKLDDDYECFDKWALLYAIGGDSKLYDNALREWNAITRQWEFDPAKRAYWSGTYREFVEQTDMLHLSEGYLGFDYLGLGNPDVPENIVRARRFAGFYTGEDPEAKNYDPQYKIIRSIATGSRGPAETAGAEYIISWGHASLYPFVKDLEWDWAKDPKRRAEIQELYDKVIVPCDVPINMAVCGLVANAYLYTGDEKYKQWILDYVGAWMERIKENNGILPDNIGRTGKIGEYRNGQWWGGFFGWTGRYSIHMISIALISAMESAQLVSGDDKYLDLLRSQVEMLLANSIVQDGQLLIPYKPGPDGWEDYRPMEPYILSHLWHSSMKNNDWRLIERLKAGSKFGPPPYEGNPQKPDRPLPGSELWHPDSTIVDWNHVNNNIKQTVRQHYNEAPHLMYLSGQNPDWPEKIMKAEYDHVLRAIGRLNDSGWKSDWEALSVMEQNPVFTNGLIQMTMGAPWVSFCGGLLMARVRYFDPYRARPGLPPDVAALVEKLEDTKTVLKLVNLNVSETRRIIIQGGAYGEHSFTDVKVINDTLKNNQQFNSIAVNNIYFAVELPPSSTVTLEISTKRFVNKPSFAFPWKQANAAK